VKTQIEKQKKEHGWEFLFIGANIDAVETAARYGIERNRAVNYVPDAMGTRTVFDSVSKVVCSVCQDEELADSWCEEIDEDYRCRGKKA
jgi:hypothetical protein